MNKLQSVKEGDIVTRYLCGIEDKLKVSRVTKDAIECGPWTFDRETGREIDDEIDMIGSASFIIA